MGGATVVARALSIDLQNVIALPPSIAATDGYSEIQVTGRDVTGEMTIEAELASVIDVDTQLKSGTCLTLTTGNVGSTAGNRFAVTSATNGLVWKDRRVSDGDGLRLRQMPFDLRESSSGNDEVALAFT